MLISTDLKPEIHIDSTAVVLQWIFMEFHADEIN
jgi:hypothetical protein